MSLKEFIFHDGQFLGIAWSVWKVLGWVGNVVFFSRFFVQWYATEKNKQVTVPAGFWWLSLVGSVLLLIYGVHKRDSVFIFAYAFTWIPYIRNLMIHYRQHQSRVECPCGVTSPSRANFCSGCGNKLREVPSPAASDLTRP